jgi:hypothetical protein
LFEKAFQYFQKILCHRFGGYAELYPAYNSDKYKNLEGFKNLEG